MSDLTVALITIFGTVASVTGVVLYVFNGTKVLIREIHGTQKEILESMKTQHQDVFELLKTQHQDVVELLKKGFGEVLQHRAT